MVNRKYFLVILTAIALAFVLPGCGNKGEKAPDVSGESVNLQTVRFDKEMYALQTDHLVQGLQELNKKYPEFLNYFLDTLMDYGIYGKYSDTTRNIREGLHEYLTFKDYKNLEDTINKYYPDTKDIDAELTHGFQYMKHFLPGCRYPKVYYLNLILKFQQLPIIIVDSTTAFISLDMFVGPQYPYYHSVGIPDYLAPHLRKNYIPVSFFTAVYERIKPFAQDDRTLLDMMIQRGKMQYFLHKVLPAMPDSVRFGFTGNQVSWCDKNEANLYNFFIMQNLLFKKEERAIIPYIVDGPFAKGIGNATDPGNPTPGNVGTWLGYKIVSAYMDQHPTLSLSDLIFLKEDAAQFLTEAKYKPK